MLIWCYNRPSPDFMYLLSPTEVDGGNRIVFVLNFVQCGCKQNIAIEIVTNFGKMQCDENECEASTSRKAMELGEICEIDTALEELKMITSRKDYLNKKQLLNLVEMDSRYVSSVSIGLRMKSVHPHGQFRVKPYYIPRREVAERHRTKSENSDSIESNTSLVASVIDAVVSYATEEVQNIKKSKSLENVHLEAKKVTITNQPEVELVSTCIQKLKMAE